MARRALMPMSQSDSERHSAGSARGKQLAVLAQLLESLFNGALVSRLQPQALMGFLLPAVSAIYRKINHRLPDPHRQRFITPSRLAPKQLDESLEAFLGALDRFRSKCGGSQAGLAKDHLAPFHLHALGE